MQQPNVQDTNLELLVTPASDHPYFHLARGASDLFTPAPSTDSEGRGILPNTAGSGVKGCLFSPMEFGPNTSGSSLVLGSLITPKRKLSMDLDESTQDASDSGYGRGVSGSFSSCSSQESCLSFAAALEGASIKKDSSTRNPLGELTNSSARQRRTGLSQKAKRSISFPNESQTTSENHDPLCSHNRVSSLPSSLPPLPYSPLSHETSRSRLNSLHQISSPLERMTLLSPGVPTTTSQPVHNGPRRFMFPTRPVRGHSVESDGYSEVFDGEEAPSSLPSGIITLMNAPFTSTPADAMNSTSKEAPHKPLVHSTSLVRSGSSPTKFSLSRINSWSQTTTHTKREGSLKRASPCPDSSQEPKRKKPPLPVFDSRSQDMPTRVSPLKGVQLLRSQSCSLGASEHVNMSPLSPGSENIGDDTKEYALPLVKKSTVADLKCISPQTLAELINDCYTDTIEEYAIVDCRYPYEYEGGHIQGAENVWSKEALCDQFFSGPQYTPDSKRRIIVFHCEFSSKRGPAMSRFMRGIDRKKNGMAFPRLYYPELYLLEGGYKAFYEQFPELCNPNSYVRMLDDNHKEDLRHFKQRSKSWTGGDAATSKRRGRPRRSTIHNHTKTGPPPQKS